MYVRNKKEIYLPSIFPSRSLQKLESWTQNIPCTCVCVQHDKQTASVHTYAGALTYRPLSVLQINTFMVIAKKPFGRVEV